MTAAKVRVGHLPLLLRFLSISSFILTTANLNHRHQHQYQTHTRECLHACKKPFSGRRLCAAKLGEIGKSKKKAMLTGPSQGDSPIFYTFSGFFLFFFFFFSNRRLRHRHWRWRQNLHFILLFKDPSKCGRFSFFLHSANHNSEFALLSTDCLCLCASWRHLHHHQSSAIIKMQWALWWWRMEMNMVGDAFRSFPHFKASLRTRALLRSLGIARAHLTKVRHIFPLSTFPHPLHSIVLSLHSILLLFYL